MYTVSVNKLAEFIVAKTPERKRSLVRRQIQEQALGRSYPLFYMKFRGPAKQFLVGGASDTSIIADVIDDLKERKGTKWLDTDARITREAFVALQKLSPALQSLGVKFVKTPKLSAKIHFPELTVNVTPDLIVHGERNGAPLWGALRFYLAKDSIYQLGKRGAELVAVMEHLWVLNNSTGSRAPDPELSMVVECIQERIMKAPADYTAHLAVIERGCREYVQLWNSISHDEAA
jgi:hypothetical protein